MASLLIIGGSGFFGKSILDAYGRGLLKTWEIDSILVLARNAENLKRSNPELISDSIKLINSDISTCTEIPVADYVIHAAASTDAANYLAQPEVEKRNIQAGTYNYCKLAKKNHKASRIVYCSSGAVYGQQPYEVETLSEDFKGGDLDEMSPTKRDYAAAKRDAEKAIKDLSQNGVSVSIARCFAFVGKYLPRDKHFAIGNFINDGLLGNPINIKAAHPVYRSYMYADDLVKWLMTIAYHSSGSLNTYNVGSEFAISLVDLAELVAQEFDLNILLPPQSEGKVDRYIPSIEKATKELGLDLSVDLVQAVRNTIERIRG